MLLNSYRSIVLEFALRYKYKIEVDQYDRPIEVSIKGVVLASMAFFRKGLERKALARRGLCERSLLRQLEDRVKSRRRLRPTPPIRIHRQIPSLTLPWYMSVFDAELYAASCAPQHRKSPPSLQSCQPEHDNQATISTISRPGHSHLASSSAASAKQQPAYAAIQVGWTPGHSVITGTDLADATAKLAAEPQSLPPR